MTFLRTLLPLVIVTAGCVSACSAAQGENVLPTGELGEVKFHAEAAALPGVNFDTGMQPTGSPVQLQLKVSGVGTNTVDALATASGSIEEPKLTAKPGGGKVIVTGSFVLEGRVSVKMTGLPSYDGPVPGLTDVKIDFGSEAVFDPYLLDGGEVTAKADLPPIDLPPIPLPGGLPGTLKLRLAEGSTVSATFRGTCAAISGDKASYTGTITRSGNFILKPTIELDVPIKGKIPYPLPDVKIPIATPAETINFVSNAVTFGSDPGTGNVASVGSCAPAIASDAGVDASAASKDAAKEASVDAAIDAAVDSDKPDVDANLADASDADVVSDAAKDAGSDAATDGGTSSCDVVTTCQSPNVIGTVSGDTGTPSITWGGYRNEWVKFTMTEDDASVFTKKKLKLRATLTSPVGHNFNVSLYDASCVGGVLLQSTNATGNDVIDFELEDNHGHDDARDFALLVQNLDSPSTCALSATWSLKIEGNLP